MEEVGRVIIIAVKRVKKAGRMGHLAGEAIFEADRAIDLAG